MVVRHRSSSIMKTQPTTSFGLRDPAAIVTDSLDPTRPVPFFLDRIGTQLLGWLSTSRAFRRLCVECPEKAGHLNTTWGSTTETTCGVDRRAMMPVAPGQREPWIGCLGSSTVTLTLVSGLPWS
jgi:hypothetical protein